MCEAVLRQSYNTFKFKSSWGAGPWRSELDKSVWIDPATGLDCMHRRCKDGGYLCGYVAVEPGHPLFGFDHGAIPGTFGITAHRGIVESGLCEQGMESEAMCHVPAEGRPHDVWWFGFKCDEDGDFKPANRGYSAPASDQAGVYRTVDYVRSECARLAKQLADIADECAPPLALPAPDSVLSSSIVATKVQA